MMVPGGSCGALLRVDFIPVLGKITNNMNLIKITQPNSDFK